MKTAIITAFSAVFFIGASQSDAALGLITATTSADPVNVGDTFTITLSISGYTDPAEIDAYQFQVTYPSALFTFVGPFDHGSSAAGPNQQWLSMANQETDATYAPTSSDSGVVPGTIVIDFADLGFTVTEGGTVAGSGFLVSFVMEAAGVGTGTFSPAAAAGGVTLFDTNFNSVGAPSFAGVSVTVVPETGSAILLAAGALASARRRRR
jgi:hypothetical protein